ncbi:hypothetical protein [Microbacterium panaciterrae]|uniref:Uncharacterized protein n=1 Tax=Microbacterium panaciterrae TaxID=985759 RepID=A0ABP8PSI4_9MICO
MNADMDRPMTLKRTPKPAADDRVDPIDVAPPAATDAPSSEVTAPAAVEAPAAGTAPAAAAPRGKKREITVPLSNRISLEASQVLERAAEEAGSIRAALEQAIFGQWGRP